MTTICRLLVWSAAYLTVSWLNTTQAANLKPGDILVTDAAQDAIFQIDPVLGTTSTMSWGNLLVLPEDIALGPGWYGTNSIYVLDSGSKVIMEIEPLSGYQRLVHELRPVASPRGLLVIEDEESVFGYLLFYGEVGGVVAVDPGLGQYGSRVGNFQGGPHNWFERPIALAEAPGGMIYVADAGGFAFGPRILLLNPQSGATLEIAAGGSLQKPRDLTVTATGEIAVLDGKRIIIVDPTLPANNNQTVLVSGGNLGKPDGIDQEYTGNLVLANTDYTTGELVRVDSGGGQTSTQATFTWPTDLLVVPGIPLRVRRFELPKPIFPWP